jgi:hypothetical protein
MLKGHTKGSNDSGFGLIKKQYRRSNAYTITLLSESIQKGTKKTKRNSAIVLEKHDFGNWKLALEDFFNPLKGITSDEEFIFDKEYFLGEVHVRKYDDKEFGTVNLLKTTIDYRHLPKNDKFTMLPTLLDSLEQPSMPAKKQWDLYEKVRLKVPDEYQDILCPLPNIDKE